MVTEPKEQQEREWLPVGEFIRRNPLVGRLNFVYDACRRGDLKSIRVGGKILIASDALDQLLEASGDHVGVS